MLSAFRPPESGGQRDRDEVEDRARGGSKTAPGVSMKRRQLIHNLQSSKERRGGLRRNPTRAESYLWQSLRRSQLDGKKFRRQHSVGRYILDFYCPSERLGIEFDGQPHFNALAGIYDQERTWFLESFRIKIIRFENKAIFENEDWVIHKIRSCYGWQEETAPL